MHPKKIFHGTRKRPGKSRKKEKNTAFFTDFGVCLPDKKRYVCVFCCFSGVYNKFVIHAFRMFFFYQFVAQYFTKTVLRSISLYFFLRCLRTVIYTMPHLVLPPFPSQRGPALSIVPCEGKGYGQLLFIIYNRRLYYLSNTNIRITIREYYKLRF